MRKTCEVRSTSLLSFFRGLLFCHVELVYLPPLIVRNSIFHIHNLFYVVLQRGASQIQTRSNAKSKNSKIRISFASRNGTFSRTAFDYFSTKSVSNIWFFSPCSFVNVTMFYSTTRICIFFDNLLPLLKTISHYHPIFLDKESHVYLDKEPLNKKPSTRQPKIEETFRTTRKELSNIRQIAHWNRFLVQRKAVRKQCEYDIALEFNSYWRILLVIGQNGLLYLCFVSAFTTI